MGNSVRQLTYTHAHHSLCRTPLGYTLRVLTADSLEAVLTLRS